MKFEKGIFVFTFIFTIFTFIICFLYQGQAILYIPYNIAFPVLAGLAVLSAFFCAYNHKMWRTNFGRVFTLLGLGLLCWFIAEVIWVIYATAFQIEIPYPSIADIFWLLGYYPMAIGLVLHFKFHKVKTPKIRGAVEATVLLIMLAVVVLLAIIHVTIIIPVLNLDVDLIEKIVDIAYPISDVFLVGFALGISVLYRHGFLNKAWLMLLGGFIFSCIGDILFSNFTLYNLYLTYLPDQPTSLPGSLPDLFFVLSYGAFAIGFLTHISFIKKT
jgi:hypothetical protein